MGYPVTFAGLSGGNQLASLLDTNFAFAMAKDGSVVATGALQFYEGAAALPGLAFATDATSGLFLPAFNVPGVSAGAVEVMRWYGVASGINYFRMVASATGNPVIMAAAGGDTNIDLTLTPKGSGIVRTAAAVLGASFYTSSSNTGSVATTAWTTIIAAVSFVTLDTWFVSMQVTNGGATMQGTCTVMYDGTATTILNKDTGGACDFRISAGALQVQQSSGSNQTIQWRGIRMSG